MVVADMGCATGDVTIAAAPLVRPARVMGIDFSAAMVIQAKKRADAAGAWNAMFWCEGAARPSLEPRALDAVLSSMMIAYLPDLPSALRAWRELLRSGGVLAFSWVVMEDKDLLPAYEAVDGLLPPDDRWSVYCKRWAVPEVQAMLPPEMDVSTVTESVTIRYESMQHWWESAWTRAPAVAWSQIPFALRDEARRSAFTILEGLTARDGSLEHSREVCYMVARLRK
jgi:SAM-dependent methyltransferase